MKKRYALFGVYWFIALTCFPNEFAWGYIDPATTTYIIQIAAAVVITLGVSLGVFLYKFQMIITNLKVSIHAFVRRLRSNKKGTTHSEGGRADEAGHSKGFGLTEKEALERGILDYPISVRQTYPALAPDYATYFASDAVALSRVGIVTGTAKEKEAEEASSEKASFKERLQAFGHWLWDDTRTYKERAKTAVFVAAALPVTFVIFSMFDSVLQNEAKMNFSFAEIVVPVLVLSVISFVVVFGILSLLRGRAFNFFVCAFLSLLICGYLQSTFLNAGIGKLMGLPLTWFELGIGQVLINLAIWLAITALIFYLGFSKKKRAQDIFKRIVVGAPVLLIAVQFVALLSILPSASAFTANQSGGTIQTLTTKGLYDVSSNENVIVFLLDMFDQEFVDDILAEDPTFFDNLDGFTQFNNNISLYNSTFPSVANLMTDVPFDMNVTSEQYIENAYNKGTFVADVSEQGFKSNLYMEKMYTYTDGQQLEGIAENLEYTNFDIDTPSILILLGRLSALKATPLALKAPFSIHPDDFRRLGTAKATSGGEPFMADDPRFYRELKEGGLNIEDTPGQFTYYHLTGAHYPFHMNAQAQFVGEETTGVEQTKGCFLILNEYFKQMKEAGIYDDATIIITGDHPTHLLYKQLDKPMLVGLFVKPSGSAGTPLAHSDAPVTIENMRATCVAAAGGDPTPWGQTYFEVSSDEAVMRDYYNRYTAEDARTHHVAHYKVGPNARDWSQWELVELIPYDTRYWF